MSKRDWQVRKIVQRLGLKSMPIGVKFSETADGRGIDKKQRICEALDAVRRKKVLVNLSNESCICPGGCHFAGWHPLSIEELSDLFLKANVYASKEVAMASVSKQLKPVYRGRFLVLGPLDRFETDPNLVLFFVTPAQADRILGLACFEGAEPFMYYPASSVCSTINNALVTGKPDINLISIFERTRHRWSSDKLIVTLPFKDFLTVVRSLDRSGYGKQAKSSRARSPKSK